MRTLIQQIRLLLIAVQCLTRVPVPSWMGHEPLWQQQCLRFFPTVGAMVGLSGALVMGAAVAWWPPAVAVVLSMAWTVWLTRGVHEDGWAGTCGSLGLILLLGLKAVVLCALLTPLWHELNSTQSSHVQQVLLVWTMLGLVWCHAASRLVPVLLTACLPCAGDAGHAKAKTLALQIDRLTLLSAVLSTLVVAAVLWLLLWQGGWPTGTLEVALGRASLAMALAALVCGRWFGQRLGGYTDDTLGASQQLSEVMGLLAWLTVVHPVG